MGSGLEHLLTEGVISEVLARLQSGKEAEVYVVRFGGKVVAAKVYKDRATRSFKNNAEYKEGRAVRNSRSQRAINSGSRFGKAAAEDAWKTAEADALYKLHAAEVRVPVPVLFIDGVLLMELVLDETGNPARRLIDTDLTAAQANEAYHDMLGQLVRILSCDLIHGDLSPYNVLWGAAGPTVIDFPQIVSASHNSSSERFFRRDAETILGHFANIDRSLASRRGDVSEIWNAFLRRELSPDFRPSGTGRAFARDTRGPHVSREVRQATQGHAEPARDARRDTPNQAIPRRGHDQPAQAQHGPQAPAHSRGLRDRPQAPREQQHGPRALGQAPRDPHQIPRDQHQGPRGQHEAPRGQHQAPRGQHQAPRGQHQAPRDQHQAPRGQQGQATQPSRRGPPSATAAANSPRVSAPSGGANQHRPRRPEVIVLRRRPSEGAALEAEKSPAAPESTRATRS